jgi:hypothetical protein
MVSPPVSYGESNGELEFRVHDMGMGVEPICDLLEHSPDILQMVGAQGIQLFCGHLMIEMDQPVAGSPSTGHNLPVTIHFYLLCQHGCVLLFNYFLVKQFLMVQLKKLCPCRAGTVFRLPPCLRSSLPAGQGRPSGTVCPRDGKDARKPKAGA